jgi:flagellar basal-body rod protein FlgF
VFRQALAKATNGDTQLQYTKTTRTALDTSPGALRKTDNPLDVALPPGVYMAAVTPRGERYTRAGDLTMDVSGTLRTAGGATISSASGVEIKASPGGGAVHIDPDGSVVQGTTTVGKIKLVQFATPDALEPEGGGLLAVGGAGAVTEATGPLTVGSVEESNAQPVAAMTEMMQASRTFEAFQQVLDQFGEIDRKLLTTVPNGGD